MTEDLARIRAAAQTYLDGLHEGDADKLATVPGRRRNRAASRGTTRSCRSTSRRRPPRS
jgi:hypothetical protein